MIPVRVFLRNFLCYDDGPDGNPIEFDFDGSSLWSISGDNGAGKSAIFDAITYTMFGRHRGGAQRDSRLIRRGAAECEAEFDFRLDGRLYRVRRTVGRPKGTSPNEPKTRQASWFDTEADDWRPIPDTDREAELNKWVAKVLGFGYETFVASVVLLQGKSDELIMATPKDRFDILSGILEMDGYKRLEQLAGQKARDARNQGKVYDDQLATLADIAEEQIIAANEELEAAKAVLNEAQQAATRAEMVKGNAERFGRLQTGISETQHKIKELEELLTEGDKIRCEYEDWQKLLFAVPRLKGALTDLAEAARLAEKAEAMLEQARCVDLEKLDGEVRTTLDQEEQAKHRAGELQQQHLLLAQALPLLQELLRCRMDLGRREDELRELGSVAGWERRLEKTEERLQQQQTLRDEAEQKRIMAQEKRSRSAAALANAEEQLEARRAAQDEAVCSRCGQPVTPEHIQKELRQAEVAVQGARRKHQASMSEYKKTEEAYKQAVGPLQAINDELTSAKTARNRSQTAQGETAAAAAALSRALKASAGVALAARGVVADSPMEAATQALRDQQAHEDKLLREAKDARTSAEQAGRKVRGAQQAYSEAREAMQKMTADEQRLRTAAEARRGQAEVRLQDVDPAWGEPALAGDESFVSELEERQKLLQGIDRRYQELQVAEENKKALSARSEGLEREIEDIPPEHRVPLPDAEALCATAVNVLQEAQTRQNAAILELERLNRARDQRRDLENKAHAARRTRALFTRLVDLLGRNGLQARLIEAALDGIGRLANETLSRISGGQLQIRLARESGARGEEEIVIQATDLACSEEPLDVQFISGGQKFRTSVALAAGIGQYAGGSRDSVRSLIIDEGFGSLDSQGRQEMIDELQNLSQVMERIIVVSHQEDFQDRTLFPTGYVLRKAGQRTVVERFV